MTPWGHKVTVHIYVPGSIDQAALASDCVAEQLLVPNADLIGISVDELDVKPYDGEEA